MKTIRLSNKSTPILLAALVWLGFTVRLFHLATQPLSGDEAFTAVNWGSSSLSFLFTTIAQIDPQPPLALLSFYAWLKLVGDTEFAARYLAALASVIAIASTGRIGGRLLNARTGLLAGLLMAVDPFQIWSAQDLRPASLWIALSTLSMLSFLRALDSKVPTWRTTITYTLFSLTAVFSFYLEVFLIAAQSLTALALKSHHRHWFPRWSIAQLTVFSALSAWLVVGGFQNSPYRPTGAAPNILNALATLILGDTYPYQTLFIEIITAAILLFCIVTIARIRPRQAIALAVPLIFPIIALTALTLIAQRGYFRPRYLAAVSPYAIMLLAAAIAAIGQQARKRLLPASLAASVLIIAMLTSLLHYFFDPVYAKAPTWRDLATFLSASATSNDLVLQNYPDPAFTYYIAPTHATAVMPPYANAPDAETARSLADLVTSRDYIWFLPTPSDYFDKRQAVNAWLADNLQLVSDGWVGSFHVLQYGHWKTRFIPTTQTPAVTFANVATIDGFRITVHTISQTEQEIFIETFITPTHQTSSSLILFYHLLDSNQPPQLISQDDHPPQQDHLPTTSWPLNQQFRDVAKLRKPSHGNYILTFGIYNPHTNQRIPITTTRTTQPEPNAALIAYLQSQDQLTTP